MYLCTQIKNKMHKYTMFLAERKGSFAERLAELDVRLGKWLAAEKAEGRELRWAKVFLSDAQNQYQQLVDSALYQQLLEPAAISVVEQAPACGCKVALLLKTDSNPSPWLFHSIRLTDSETRGMSSYTQTVMLFDKYLRLMREQNLTLKQHCVRTWIYVGDIDNNYAGVVKARNDIFAQYGLTIDTHFIASTGIGGQSQTRSACVAMDFLTMPGIEEDHKTYLKALDHLNPTHEYGVSFERGTKVSLPDNDYFLISGTASIDRHGNVVYRGDVMRQANRLLENIDALLHDGGASLDDMQYFIVYLRDLSDYEEVERFMQERFPQKPHIVVEGKVCRPEWLIEMEGLAIK